MSLITTVGGSRSNSFVIVSEATSYLSASPFDTSVWTNLSTPEKEQRLIYAARAMDYLPWRGFRVYEKQALCFPRDFQTDVTVISDKIKETQALMAWLVIHRGLVSMSSATEGRLNASVKSVSLGGLLSVAFADSSQTGGSFLSKLVAFDEFPVQLLLGEYLAPLRVRNGAKPVLLPEVA